MAGAPSNAPRRKATSEEFIEMSKSEEFAELKSRFRGFTFPAIIIALLWFFACSDKHKRLHCGPGGSGRRPRCW